MRWQTWRTMTDKYCPTCTGAQYADDIYDAKRSNFWEYTCPFRFATGSATFGASCGNGSIQSNTSGCCGSAAQSAADSIGALRYREPLLFAAYQQRVRATDVLEQNRAASGAVLNATADAPRIGDTACIGCRDCSIEPSCGAAEFGSGCGPRPLPERRMRHNAVPFKPASSFPLLDRYPSGQAQALYAFDSEQAYIDAYNGIYNGQAPLRSRFHFQSPKEQQRLWYGVAPPNIGERPAKNIRANCDDCQQVPVPYYRNYLESRYACGCNRRQCARCAPK